MSPSSTKIGGVEQQRSSRARARLRELLRRHYAEREAGVDELVGQRVRGVHPAFDHRAETDLSGVRETLVDRAEGATVEEVGGVHRVAGASQLVREGVEARGLTLCMVEEQYLCHLASCVSSSDRDVRVPIYLRSDDRNHIVFNVDAS